MLVHPAVSPRLTRAIVLALATTLAVCACKKDEGKDKAAAEPASSALAVSTQPAPRYTPLQQLTRPTLVQGEPSVGALVLARELASTMAEAIDAWPHHASKETRRSARRWFPNLA